MVAATLGTPAALTPNTIQYPGIATPLPGTVTVAVVSQLQDAEVSPQSSRRRWSVLALWVELPMRTVDTCSSASDDVIVSVSPVPVTRPPHYGVQLRHGILHRNLPDSSQLLWAG